MTKGYGISVHDIDWSCPSELHPYELAYDLEKSIQDENRWSQGLYNRCALASTVGNMFSGKGSKPIEYPSKTFTEQEKEVRKKNDVSLMTEAEKKQARANIFNNLMIMGENFNRTHNKEGV